MRDDEALKKGAPSWRPDLTQVVVVASAIGKSGKYKYILGHHMRKGATCWDVCALNFKSKEITKRHHHTKEEALVTWEHVLRELDRINQQPEEADETDKQIILDQHGKRIN